MEEVLEAECRLPFGIAWSQDQVDVLRIHVIHIHPATSINIFTLALKYFANLKCYFSIQSINFLFSSWEEFIYKES
jgi:hypothetical protein